NWRVVWWPVDCISYRRTRHLARSCANEVKNGLRFLMGKQFLRLYKSCLQKLSRLHLEAVRSSIFLPSSVRIHKTKSGERRSSSRNSARIRPKRNTRSAHRDCSSTLIALPKGWTKHRHNEMLHAPSRLVPIPLLKVVPRRCDSVSKSPARFAN